MARSIDRNLVEGVGAAGGEGGLLASGWTGLWTSRARVARAVFLSERVWRWLHEDALNPSQQQCWIYQRDPNLAAKAG